MHVALDIDVRVCVCVGGGVGVGGRGRIGWAICSQFHQFKFPSRSVLLKVFYMSNVIGILCYNAK